MPSTSLLTPRAPISAPLVLTCPGPLCSSHREVVDAAIKRGLHITLADVLGTRCSCVLLVRVHTSWQVVCAAGAGRDASVSSRRSALSTVTGCYVPQRRATCSFPSPPTRVSRLGRSHPQSVTALRCGLQLSTPVFDLYTVTSDYPPCQHCRTWYADEASQSFDYNL